MAEAALGSKWKSGLRGEIERASRWNRTYDARGVQRCHKRALGGPVSSASSTMAEQTLGRPWQVELREVNEPATGPKRSHAPRGAYWCTWRGLGRTKTTTPTTCHGGRSKRVRREGYGAIGTHRARGGGEGA